MSRMFEWAVLRFVTDGAMRALVRPFVGGLFAWAIILILLSGLILEPMIEPFLTEDGAIDTSNTTAVMFFLAVGVVAGFSEELAINLLGRTVGAFDSSNVREPGS